MAGRNVMEEALKYLSQKAYTEQKLTVKLIAAGFTAVGVKECLIRLNNWGYINDREYGITRIQQLRERLKSRSYIIADLENNGLAKDLIVELIEIYYSEAMEREIAQKIIKKHSLVKNSKTKIWHLLMRAGFSENTIRYCFPDIDPT